MPHRTRANKDSTGIASHSLAYRHVDLLHTRFPDARDIADELLGRSESFRALVEDYGACADELERYAKNGVGRSLNQYTTLRFTLERVLLQYIKDHRHNDNVI